jgi:hypothetical protein
LNGVLWTEGYRRGDHVIQVYSSERERLRTVCEILNWIDEDDLFIYIVDDLGLDSLGQLDGSMVKRIKKGIAQGRLRLMESTSFYLENGAFNLKSRMTAWATIINEIRDEGFKSLVVVGDLSWSANNPGLFSELLQYEATLSITGLPQGFTAVCQYDSRLFSQKEIDYIESVHELQLKDGNLQRNFWLVSQRYY